MKNCFINMHCITCILSVDFIVKYSLNSTNNNKHVYSNTRTLICLSFCIPFVVHLCAPHLLKRYLCLFQVFLKWCRTADLLHSATLSLQPRATPHVWSILTTPHPHFTSSHHVSTCCRGCFLFNLHVIVSCDR